MSFTTAAARGEAWPRAGVPLSSFGMKQQAQQPPVQGSSPKIEHQLHAGEAANDSVVGEA